MLSVKLLNSIRFAFLPLKIGILQKLNYIDIENM